MFKIVNESATLQCEKDGRGICDVYLVWELVSHIAQELNPQDLFNFSLSCRTLQWLIRDDHICAMVLEVSCSLKPTRLSHAHAPPMSDILSPPKESRHSGVFRSLTLTVFTWKSTAPFAPETKAAHKSKNYAKALRLIVKRSTAILSASSYLAALVAEAESFLYSNGVVCYFSNGLLRIRDLHNSALEDTINVGKLLKGDDGLSRTIKDEHDFKLRILNYADGFVSCYLNPGNRSFPRLLVISRSHGSLFSHILASSRKIFVRNNDRYLYYGTHSAIARDGSQRWVLRGCSLLNGIWHNNLTHLPDRIGSDIGANICFEIIDGYFYALGSQRHSLHDSYICVRFRIDQAENMEEWQEFHSGGLANIQRSLITQDERTGVLTIVDGGIESGEGASARKRTYYRRRLQFPGNGDKSALSSTGPLTIPGYEGPSRPAHASDHNAASLRLLTPSDTLLMCYSDRPFPSQRIRLRVNLTHFTAPDTANPESPTPDERVERQCMSRTNLWSPPGWDNDKNVKALNDILSPQLEQNFIWMWDEGLKCYTQAGLLNTVLDPSIRLQGTRKWVNAFLEVLGEDLGASCPESRIQDPDPSGNSAYEVWVTEVMAFHRCAGKAEINPTVWYHNKRCKGPSYRDQTSRGIRDCKTRCGANLNKPIAISAAAHRIGQSGGWDGLTLVEEHRGGQCAI
ncbi:uncharacterized protein PpBr36_10361 [Pyricularia pennisetigena]|uniref:uncharacterized protein n=1 Tax=Pyricularia pennisetigena TaxID=1578925 RepID=UPI0011523BF7|nr:uncharacterized protein PpBr36_10361 [Pyricularia pennisetigena]TLS21346.1 hypothetical protein PpBr36_10361 [Pyricularia pennisetigena]